MRKGINLEKKALANAIFSYVDYALSSMKIKTIVFLRI